MNRARMSADSKRSRKSHDSSFNNKPNLQTKWKDRVNSSAIYDQPPSSHKSKNEPKNEF